MMSKYLINIFLLSILFVSHDIFAQSFIGLSVNYGDKLTFTPNYPDLLLQRRSFTPTLVYAHQKKLQSDFSLIMGGQVGISGYQLIPELGDTLSTSVVRHPFIDYGIFVCRFEITAGKVFHLGNRELFIGVGGGISYYRVFPYTSMGVIVIHQGTGVTVFDSYIESPDAGIFAGLGKVYMQTELSKRLDIAVQYSMHWRSILNGEFEFYHTRTPAEGSIKLIPQGISLMLLYRLHKIN